MYLLQCNISKQLEHLEPLFFVQVNVWKLKGDHCFNSGMTAGAVGSFIGTPAEISLIRMTSDGRFVTTLFI